MTTIDELKIRVSADLKDLGPGMRRGEQVVDASSASIARSFGRATVSAGQLRAATASLPAQFTDIFTSLQAGQNPLTVFLQQGGQIKDQFGGAGAALKAVSGYIAGMINPVTVSAAAIAALGYAWYRAEAEVSAFNKALALTNNYAGITYEQARKMADGIAGTTGAAATAMGALTAAAESGRLTGESLLLVGEAAAVMEDATGKAVDKTIAEFIRIQDDPVKAILELDKSMHFLDASTLRRIVTLQEQGRTEEAAAEATKAYAAEINTASSKVIADLGFLETNIRAVEAAASETWAALKILIMGGDEWLGKALRDARDTGLAKLATDAIGPDDIRDQLKEAGLYDLYSEIEAGVNADERDAAEAKRRGDAAYKRQIEAAGSLLTNAEKRKLELDRLNRDVADIRAAGIPFSDEEEAQRRAQIEKKYSLDGNAGQRKLDDLTRDTAAFDAQASATVKLTQAEKERVEWLEQRAQLEEKRRTGGASSLTEDEKSILDNADKISAAHDKRAEASRRAAAREKELSSATSNASAIRTAEKFLSNARQRGAALEAQIAATSKLTQDERAIAEFNQKIADLKSKTILTAAEKAVLATEAETRAQLEKNVALSKEAEERKAAIKAAERLKSIFESIDAARQNQRDQYIRQLTGVGLGDQARTRLAEQQAIVRDYNRYIEQYLKQEGADPARVEEIRGRLAEALRDQRAYYSELDRLNGDWAIGAKEAFADYVDSARNVAAQTKALFTDALSGVEDAFVKLVTTGKVSLGELATVLEADIARMTFRRAAGEVYDGLLSDLFSSGGRSDRGAEAGLLDDLAGLFVSPGESGSAAVLNKNTAAVASSLNPEAKAGCCMTDEMRSVFSDASSSLSDIARDAWEALGSIADGALDGLDAIIQGLIQFLTGSSTVNGASGLTDLFGDAGGIFSSLFGSSVSWGGLSGSGGGVNANPMAFGGPRAAGGPINPGKFYEVAERGPELFSTGGKTFLVAGNAGGFMTPIQGDGRQAASGNTTINMTINTPDARSFLENERAVRNRMLRRLSRA